MLSALYGVWAAVAGNRSLSARLVEDGYGRFGGASSNMDFVTTTGNVIMDLLHNFHLECGARLHKLRVYETVTEPTGGEVCRYLLVRGGVHAHAYALALKKLTGVDIASMLPVPNISLDRIPEAQKYLDEARTGGSIDLVRTITRKCPVSRQRGNGAPRRAARRA